MGNQYPESEDSPLQDWREVLSQILQKDKEEHGHLQERLPFKPVTFWRWMNDKTTVPRKTNLLQLLKQCDVQEKERLFAALQRANLLDVHDLEQSSEGGEYIEEEDITVEEATIPPAFYAQVFSAIRSTAAPVRAWTICHFVMRHCPTQLKIIPGEQLYVSLLECTPPLEGYPIRSLRQLAFAYENGAGKVRFEPSTDNRFLLGVESLPARTCETLQIMVEQPVTLESTLQFGMFFSPTVVPKSAIAVPLLRSGRFGGCILVVSSQANFFTETRKQLLQNYADLAAQAFDDTKYYDASRLNFMVMPAITEQNLSVQEHIILMSQSQNEGQQQAALQAWHAIENEYSQKGRQRFM